MIQAKKALLHCKKSPIYSIINLHHRQTLLFIQLASVVPLLAEMKEPNIVIFEICDGGRRTADDGFLKM